MTVETQFWAIGPYEIFLGEGGYIGIRNEQKRGGLDGRKGINSR